MHSALKAFKQKEKVKVNQKNNTQSHIVLVRKILKCLATDDFSIFYERENWFKANQRWAQEALDFYLTMSEVVLSSKDSQTLHGQIHPGNVLFTKDKAYIFDIETSIKSYGTVLWDLAYLIQRFGYSDNFSEAQLLNRLKLVQQEYDNELLNLPDMMRYISIFNIVSGLYYRVNDNWLVPEHEYSKHFRFYKQAKDIERLIKINKDGYDKNKI